VSISLALPTTGIPVSRIAVTATPHYYADNFTSATLDPSWMIDCGASCPTEVVSTQLRPGFMRFFMPSIATVNVDTWTFRGNVRCLSVEVPLQPT
jgi:hypothetical protein